jgi:hypothetical protein
LFAAKVLELLEDTIKRVLWEEQDKFLKPPARDRLAAHGIPASAKYEDVQAKFAIRLADYFHLLSGTSTGGLLSLYCESRVVTHAASTHLASIHISQHAWACIHISP